MTLVGVLSNPLSTRNAVNLGAVRDVVEDFNGVFHFEIGDIRDVSLALRRFAEYGAEVIAINGGDGTIHAVFSTLINESPFEKMPLIAILPAGKTNMIAEDLGAVQPKPQVYLRRLLAWCRDNTFKDHLTRRHILKVEGLDRQRPIYGMFMGTAGIVEGISYCRRRIYPLKLPNFLSHGASVVVLFFRATLGALFNKRKDQSGLMQVTLDRKGTVMGRYFVVIATTLHRLILGFRPFRDDGAGPVHFFSVEESPSIVARAIALVLTGRLKDRVTAGVTARNANILRLRLSSPVTIDGEMYNPPAGREIIVSGGDAFTFIRFDGDGRGK